MENFNSTSLVNFDKVIVKEESPENEIITDYNKHVIYLPEVFHDNFKVEFEDFETVDRCENKLNTEHDTEEEKALEDPWNHDISNVHESRCSNVFLGITKSESHELYTETEIKDESEIMEECPYDSSMILGLTGTEIVKAEECSAENEIQTLSNWSRSCTEAYDSNMQDVIEDYVNDAIITQEIIHKLFTCSLCKRDITLKQALSEHVCVHDEKMCPVCKKSFVQNMVKAKEQLICTKCVKISIEQRDLPDKLRKHECIVCRKLFAEASYLKKHLLIHAGVKPHECLVCKKKFREAGALRKHALTHTGLKPYECNVCHKKFREAGTLRNHTLIHTGLKPYECSVCDKKFREASTLRKHALTHTGLKPYECSVCYKKFREAGTLRKHALIHIGLKPYECSVCYKKFREAGTLKKHVLTHTELKPHDCSVCHKKFRQSAALKRHMRIHTEVKHECTTCRKKFHDSVALGEHMLIHAKVKSFECTVCRKKLGRAYSLKIHMAKHTGIKP